ncbi:lipoprotein [Salmonella enterica subsp. enterica serovar Daytona]|uniref:Lipoprotein n=1 Tax=Salmonella enterica subsp. enterica serovar Daytona TaxID=1962639 RepID=A0A447JEC1_SALET|nr:lipoprotein [Salmonella enterica subsp. enterica serovar Daytona]
MPERMALNLTAQKTPLAPADEVKFSVVGYYLYGAPANGNTLQGQLFLRPLRDAVAALPGFQFGNIAEENLSRSLDEVQLTLDKGGRGEVSAASQWQEAHSPLQVILQASPAGVWRSSGHSSRRAADLACRYVTGNSSTVHRQSGIRLPYGYHR